MRTWRHLAFLFMVCAAVVALKVDIFAGPTCAHLSVSTCGTAANPFNRVGDYCTMQNDTEPCSKLGETCNSYCEGHVDGAAGGCSTNGSGRSSGICWCSDWVNCPPPPPPPPECDPTGSGQMNCSADGGSWDWGSCSCNYSPILVKLGDGGRYDLTGTTNGVNFDINGDGDKERTAWTEAGVDEAFLVLDRNGNGTIDSAAEMFGNLTPLRNGDLAPNGFEALKDLVAGSPNHADVIDASDPVFRVLRLWTDANHNGISEPNELQTLRQAGIDAISLAYREVHRRDENGNLLAFQGTVVMRQHGRTVTRKIYDVYFKLATTT